MNDNPSILNGNKWWNEKYINLITSEHNSQTTIATYLCPIRFILACRAPTPNTSTFASSSQVTTTRPHDFTGHSSGDPQDRWHTVDRKCRRQGVILRRGLQSTALRCKDPLRNPQEEKIVLFQGSWFSFSPPIMTFYTSYTLFQEPFLRRYGPNND